MQPTAAAPAAQAPAAVKSRKTPPNNEPEAEPPPPASPAPSKSDVKKPKFDPDSGIMEFSRSNPPQIPKAAKRESVEVQPKETVAKEPTPSATRESYQPKSAAQEFYSSRDSVDGGGGRTVGARELKSPSQKTTARTDSQGSAATSYATARQNFEGGSRLSTDLNGSLSGSVAGGGDWVSPAARSTSSASMEVILNVRFLKNTNF